MKTKFCPHCGKGLDTLFAVGTRVQLNDEWIRAAGSQWENYPKGRKGVVTGPSRSQHCIMVRLDGTKRPSSWHVTFFDKVRGKA